MKPNKQGFKLCATKFAYRFEIYSRQNMQISLTKSKAAAAANTIMRLS